MTEVRKSRIKGAGYGLFATRDYQKGEFVTNYGGILRSQEAVDSSPCKYIFRDKWGFNWDAEIYFDPETERGRWINDDLKGGNTFWVSREMRQPPKIFTKTKVKKGEEFYLSYGPEYWI